MRKEFITMVLLMGVCVACQNEELESNVVLDNIESEVFDLKYIMENADSVSYGTYTIIDMIEPLDSINNGGGYEPQGGIVTGDEYWVGNDCYILVEFAASKSVTHPAITSPISNVTGFCGLTANIYYTYYHVYKRINNTDDLATYYTCVANIQRTEVRMQNFTDKYLLWQDGGSRSYCPSSSYHPVLYPQTWIYVIFQGRIVGERGFFNPYVDADEQIYWETSFRIPME